MDPDPGRWPGRQQPPSGELHQPAPRKLTPMRPLFASPTAAFNHITKRGHLQAPAQNERPPRAETPASPRQREVDIARTLEALTSPSAQHQEYDATVRHDSAQQSVETQEFQEPTMDDEQEAQDNRHLEMPRPESDDRSFYSERVSRETHISMPRSLHYNKAKSPKPSSTQSGRASEILDHYFDGSDGTFLSSRNVSTVENASTIDSDYTPTERLQHTDGRGNTEGTLTELIGTYGHRRSPARATFSRNNDLSQFDFFGDQGQKASQVPSPLRSSYANPSRGLQTPLPRSSNLVVPNHGLGVFSSTVPNGYEDLVLGHNVPQPADSYLDPPYNQFGGFPSNSSNYGNPGTGPSAPLPATPDVYPPYYDFGVPLARSPSNSETAEYGDTTDLLRLAPPADPNGPTPPSYLRTPRSPPSRHASSLSGERSVQCVAPPPPMNEDDHRSLLFVTPQGCHIHQWGNAEDSPWGAPQFNPEVEPEDTVQKTNSRSEGSVPVAAFPQRAITPGESRAPEEPEERRNALKKVTRAPPAAFSTESSNKSEWTRTGPSRNDLSHTGSPYMSDKKSMVQHPGTVVHPGSPRFQHQYKVRDIANNKSAIVPHYSYRGQSMFRNALGSPRALGDVEDAIPLLPRRTGKGKDGHYSDDFELQTLYPTVHMSSSETSLAKKASQSTLDSEDDPLPLRSAGAAGHQIMKDLRDGDRRMGSSPLARDNSYSKFTELGPHKNVTGTPAGSGMKHAGSSVIGLSSPTGMNWSSPADAEIRPFKYQSKTAGKQRGSHKNEDGAVENEHKSAAEEGRSARKDINPAGKRIGISEIEIEPVARGLPTHGSSEIQKPSAAHPASDRAKAEKVSRFLECMDLEITPVKENPDTPGSQDVSGSPEFQRWCATHDDWRRDFVHNSNIEKEDYQRSTAKERKRAREREHSREQQRRDEQRQQRRNAVGGQRDLKPMMLGSHNASAMYEPLSGGDLENNRAGIRSARRNRRATLSQPALTRDKRFEEEPTPAALRKQEKISKRLFWLFLLPPFVDMAAGFGVFDSSIQSATRSEIQGMNQKWKRRALVLGTLVTAIEVLIIILIVIVARNAHNN